MTVSLVDVEGGGEPMPLPTGGLSRFPRLPDYLDGTFFMWMWLDRVGLILFDAALSTGLFLTVVVLAMLVCRQPSRRLLLVRSSLVASLAIIPVVAVLPLPRVDVLDLILQRGIFPPSSSRIDPGARQTAVSGATGGSGCAFVRLSRFSKETTRRGPVAGCRVV